MAISELKDPWAVAQMLGGLNYIWSEVKGVEPLQTGWCTNGRDGGGYGGRQKRKGKGLGAGEMVQLLKCLPYRC